jgi:N-acetylmuramoyl-L-alanine amidase
MTLDLAGRVETALSNLPRPPRVILTRNADVNLSLEDRAHVARDNNAQLFLSIHFNGFDGVARGVLTLVDLAARNVNFDDDVDFANNIQDAVLRVIRSHDPGTNDRGVEEQSLGVLRDDRLGNTAANHPCRACLAEIEFIDVAAVDQLLNVGPDAETVKNEIAAAIAGVIHEEVGL